jgi:hypothetical protein
MQRIAASSLNMFTGMMVARSTHNAIPQRIEGGVIDVLYLEEKGTTIVACRFPVE